MLYLRHGKHQDGSDDWQIYCCGPGLTVARLNLKVREEQKLKIQKELACHIIFYYSNQKSVYIEHMRKLQKLIAAKRTVSIPVLVPHTF